MSDETPRRLGRNVQDRKTRSALSRRLCLCEPLEPRWLLSVNLGTMTTGRFYFPNETAKGTFTSDGLTSFQFTVPDCEAQIQMSRALEIGDVGIGDFWISLEGGPSSYGDGTHREADQELGVKLKAGTYTLDVANAGGPDLPIHLAFSIDHAPAAEQDNPPAPVGFLSNVGANIGTLSAGTATFQDFVGWPDRSIINHIGDTDDMYLFDVPFAGSVSATLDGLATDPAGGDVNVGLTLYHDTNNDGVFEDNEAIATQTPLTPGSIGNITSNLLPGSYGLDVSGGFLTSFQVVAGGTNYRLRLAYTQTDFGGDTIASPANLGIVGAVATQRTDSLSPLDPTDVYKFSTVQGGPFVFNAELSGMSAGTDYLVQLINDANGNQQVDSGEVVTSQETFNGGNVHLSTSLLTGTYYVRISRIGGEGTYTLSLSNTNTDKGGPAGSPTNLDVGGTFHGSTHIADTVSATDVDDYYRVDLDAPGIIQASFPATALNTNADLQIGRDLNGNGQIDAGEQVALSNNPGNAAESINARVAPGTYLVRVFRTAGTPQYDLTINADFAGSDAFTARLMGLSGASATTSEWIGPGDATDYFKVPTTSPVQLNAFLTSVADPVTVAVGQDLSGDGILQDREISFVSHPFSGRSTRLSVNLPTAGTWLLAVTSTDPVGTNYGISLASAPVDNAGNTESQARDLGVLGAPQTVADFVGDGSINAVDDVDDFYRFTVGASGPYVFVEQTPFATGQAIIQLIEDRNSNGVIDPGEIIATTVSPAANVAPPPLVVSLIDPGTYYVHVLRFTGEVSYSMSLQAISTDAAGNNSATAATLGILGPGPSSLSTSTQFVGRIDNDDFFRVNVTAPISGGVLTIGNVGELSATLTGAAAPAYVQLVPLVVPTIKGGSTGTSLTSSTITDVVDGTSNTIDLGQATSIGAPGNDVIQGLVVSPQTYLAIVHSDVDTNYNLTVSFSPQLPFLGTPVVIDGGTLGTGNTIEAENFDTGGEGIAYHDSTPTNTGGAYRPNEGVDIFPNPSGGFYVDDTRVGESLSYTIFAAANAQYDIDVSAAAASPGALFHLEVDGSPVGTPNQLSVPATGSDTNFALVTTRNILLTQGPHVLRLVMDAPAVASFSCGAFDFITVRRSQQSIGTFQLTGANTTVPDSGIATLGVQWTVPGTSWHDLTAIDLRLRDDQGIVMWLRFDEASQTISLYNAHSGKFGPAKKIGSNGTLSNGDVRIDLSEIRLVAAGPNSPTVNLTFPIHFLHKMHRHLLIEVAATDDAGHIGDFVTAGTLDA